MQLFVTGGTGFIGQHLIKMLVAAGHQVRALVRPGRRRPADCLAVEGDLCQSEGFSAALEGCQAVIHAAALLDPIRVPQLAETVNRQATLQLARAAARQQVDHFVFVSSIAAIGLRHMPELVRTDVPCRPDTIYGCSKRAAELDLLALGEHGPRVTIIRPPTVYGPGEHGNFLSLTRAISTGLFPIPGGGKNRISFCHVMNLCQALQFLVEHPAPAGLYHVTDLPVLTFRQTVTTIARALGTRPLPLPFPRALAYPTAVACELGSRLVGREPSFSRRRLKTLTGSFALDCGELLEHGYRPQHTFAAGVEQTVSWYRGGKTDHGGKGVLLKR